MARFWALVWAIYEPIRAASSLGKKLRYIEAFYRHSQEIASPSLLDLDSAIARLDVEQLTSLLQAYYVHVTNSNPITPAIALLLRADHQDAGIPAGLRTTGGAVPGVCPSYIEQVQPGAERSLSRGRFFRRPTNHGTSSASGSKSTHPERYRLPCDAFRGRTGRGDAGDR